jgi:hypothetical protein
MDKNAGDRLKKVRSNYDVLAGAYAREISGELAYRLTVTAFIRHSP